MQNITEEAGVHKEWYEEAKEQTLETLPAFLKKLTEDYGHDYGTIVHAVAASAIGAATAVDHSPTGGITGFQAGAIMWEFIQHWTHEGNKCGLRLMDYDDMLYPQYEQKFMEKKISQSTWGRLQEQAKICLDINEEKRNMISPSVVKHWESIVAGNVPFGYTVDSPEL